MQFLNYKLLFWIINTYHYTIFISYNIPFLSKLNQKLSIFDNVFLKNPPI